MVFQQKNKILNYQNVEAALDELNAEDKGHYYVCSCPECFQNEAFIYKNNVSVIQCNRENICGERMLLKYHEKTRGYYKAIKQKTDYPSLNDDQENALEWVTKVCQLGSRNFASDTLDNGYRGLSKDTTKDIIVDFQNKDVVKFMFQKAKALFGKDYAKSNWMCKRNLVFPIYGEDGSVERMLMRSSIDPNLDPKEIQLILNPSKETRDFFVDIPAHAKTVVVTESILDALSFKEVDKNIGFIALTGSSKTKKATAYITDHLEQFKDKICLVSMDNDRAGKKAEDAMIRMMDRNGLDWNVFSYTTFCKDANENLIKDRDSFIAGLTKHGKGTIKDFEYQI